MDKIHTKVFTGTEKYSFSLLLFLFSQAIFVGRGIKSNYQNMDGFPMICKQISLPLQMASPLDHSEIGKILNFTGTNLFILIFLIF